VKSRYVVKKTAGFANNGLAGGKFNSMALSAGTHHDLAMKSWHALSATILFTEGSEISPRTFEALGRANRNPSPLVVK
jgi:hypothetical protein